MNFCTSCGSPRNAGKFCENCGAPYPAPEAGATEAAAPVTAATLLEQLNAAEDAAEAAEQAREAGAAAPTTPTVSGIPTGTYPSSRAGYVAPATQPVGTYPSSPAGYTAPANQGSLFEAAAYGTAATTGAAAGVAGVAGADTAQAPVTYPAAGTTYPAAAPYTGNPSTPIPATGKNANPMNIYVKVGIGIAVGIAVITLLSFLGIFAVSCMAVMMEM